MYALLCRKLCEEAPNFDLPSNNTGSHNNNTFRRLLLAKCQDEFENRRKASEAFDKKDGVLSSEEEEQRTVAKHKMLGNIKFIGELGKQGLLHEAILHQCVHQLLTNKKRQTTKDMAQDLECLCQIMKTVGHRLDTDKAKALMNQYFERMQFFAISPELPSRIRFMLQDSLELRQNRWVPRRILSDHGPKTIQQVREEAARDFGNFMTAHVLASRNTSFSCGNNSLSNMGKLRGGLDDVFTPAPIGVGTLGTGPGVISVDTFPSYSNNMGRPARGIMNSGGFLNSGSVQPFFNSNRNKQFSNRDRDHDLFINYQQQQQRPQSQNNLGFTSNNITRDLPPRFLKKSLQTPTGNTEEISLRPAQNSMIGKGKPVSAPFVKTSLTSVPLSPGGGTNSTLLPNALPTMQKEAPVTIVKQASQDKNKSNKQMPSKDEVMKKVNEFLTEFLSTQNLATGTTAFKEIKIPKKFVPEILIKMMMFTLEKTDSDRELLSQLLTELKKESLVSGNHVMEALKSVFQQMSAMEAEVPRVKSHVAGFAARSISSELVSLTQVSEPLEGGAHYPLFLLCLQQLHKAQGQNWLQQTYNHSKINLLNMLPEMDRTRERLADILEDRGLSFLIPLLRIQADLWRQLQTDPSPNALYRWIKDTIDISQHTVPGFVGALISCMIKYITQETTLADGIDLSVAPDKIILDKEKEMLDKFKPVFQAFLHEQPKLQLVALYSLQVHCFNAGFPKGMLLRWFMNLYDSEIIEEEPFLRWREDVNDDYPGKGKALFQVNQWLTWLEEAEEEGSDDNEN